MAAGALIAGRARISRAIQAVDLVLTSVAVPLLLFALAAPAWAALAAVGGGRPRRDHAAGAGLTAQRPRRSARPLAATSADGPLPVGAH
jgi:hypothetical protein